MTVPPRLRVVGAGRAGRSLAGALAGAGWEVVGLLGRDDDPAGAAAGADLVVVATPDAAIAAVAAAIEPSATAVVAHLSGALGLDVLAPHARRAGLHPLVSLPDAELGATRLASGAWFAVAGDPLAQRAVADLHGRWFEVADADRAAYHAAAVVASNHLVALLGQVARIAEGIGVPPEAYLDLARATLENVAASVPPPPSPARRPGDWATIAGHLEVLEGADRAAYLALADLARRLVDPAGLPPDL